ncbi:glycosyltransferase family 2 protein [Candidatus Gottesmanbacteria bacterium]|nr:glycosyltransferase family 2 protein [Candidatus Gottesmanbacteria bacterium]
MNRRVDLSLVLPCYNEAGLFAESVTRITAVLDAMHSPYEIIFVDDKSRDNTRNLIEQLIASEGKNSKFRAIYHTHNQGRGKTVRDGIRTARAPIVGYIDIDCEVDPVYIPRLISLIKEGAADIAIGKRYYRSSPKAVVREILSRGYQWLSDMMIGTGGLDTETGYKFFSRKKILPLLAKATHPGWFWDTEIMVYARRANLVIAEVPVLFLRRFDKQSSVNIVRDTLDYMVELVRFRKQLASRI